MITQEQIDNLKTGDKLIFFRNGGVLSTNVGNVYTFSNWWKGERNYWQSIETIEMGNHVHNFCIYDVELFDESVHTKFKMMDEDALTTGISDFIRDYGN